MIRISPELESHLTRRSTLLGVAATLVLWAPASLQLALAQPRAAEDITPVMSVVVTTLLAAVCAYVTAAATTGADLRSGALAQSLTQGGDRDELYASRLKAATTAGVLVAVVTQAATLVLTRFTAAQLSGWGFLLVMAGFGVLIAALAAVLGVATAVLTRSFLGALGVLVAALLALLGTAFVLAHTLPPSGAPAFPQRWLTLTFALSGTATLPGTGPLVLCILALGTAWLGWRSFRRLDLR